MLEGMRLPRLYAVADAELLASHGLILREFAEGLHAAGVGLVQWRDKVGSPQEVLAGAGVLREVLAETGCRLVMNDRADLAVLAEFDGVHVGQEDLSPEDARAVVLLHPNEQERSLETPIRTSPTHRKRQERDEWGTRIPGQSGEVSKVSFLVGFSTHTEEQVRVAELSCADYVAVGPVFATGTKLDAEAVIGLDGVRRARELTRKPIVAIGGITRQNARSVIEAGAESVAVISGLIVRGESVEKVARDFLRILG